MSETKAKRDLIQIKAGEDGDRQVLIHPADDDLFVRTGKEVINACQLDISIELWMREFESAMESVQQWSDERDAQVASCHCSPQGGKIAFFFCPTSDKFDFALADDLAQLNLDLRQTFNIGMVEVQQIPWAETGRFLHPGMARWVYGRKLKRTSTSVEA